jgi:hypothetical protein
MNENKLIAGALLEISKRGTSTFLEVGKEDKELIEAAKKIGIELPSPDLMVMKTVYAEIDKVNLNGVILPRKAVEKGLPTLIGKQCNWEHNGSGFVCGYTISAKINGDKIETINVLFKSLFIDQADELKEKVKSGEAAVSFEIWNKNPDTGKSVVKELDNGFREINPIIFHGTGVLLAHKPACPKAKIFKLVAKKELEEAEKIIDKVFEQDLVYAQLAIEEPKCVNCGNCDCEKEVTIVEELNDKQISEIETKTEEKATETKTEEVAETKVEEPKVEETKTEVITEVKPEETPKVEAETKVEEPKVEEKPEEKKEVVAEEIKEVAQPLEVIEPKIIVKVSDSYEEIRVDTYIDGTPSGKCEVKMYHKKVTEYKDGTKDEITEEMQSEKMYKFAELEEAVNKAKEELTNLHKAELEAKTNEVKVLLEQKIAEKETEISNLKKELDAKAQEVAELKKPKVEEAKEEPVVEMGDTEVDTKSEIKKEAQKINKIIANKGK